MSSLTDFLQEQLAGTTNRYDRLPLILSIVQHLAVVDPDQALEHAEKAVTMAQGLNERALALALRERAICRLGCNNFSGADNDLRAARKIFIRRGDDQDLAIVMLCTGTVHLYRRDHRRAIKQFEGSRETSEKCAYIEGEIGALQALANTYATIGNDPEALRYYHDAIKRAEAIKVDGILGVLLSDLAIFNEQRHNHERALELFEQAYKLFEFDPFRPLAIRTLSNIASILYSLNDLDTAETYAMRAMFSAMQIKESRDLAIALSTLGNIQEKRGDPVAALDWQKKALDMLNGNSELHGATKPPRGNRIIQRGDVDNRSMRSIMLLNIGNLHRKLAPQRKPENFDDAIYYLTELVHLIHQERGDNQILYRAHELLADIYEQKCEYAHALAHTRLFVDLREEVHNREREREVAEIQIRFDVERANREREQMRLELDNATKEVKATALHQIEITSQMEKIHRDLIEIRKESNGRAGKLVDRLLRFLKEHSFASDQSETIMSQLMSRRFIHILSVRHPDLTRKHLIVCGLIRAQLSTKEIAIIMSVAATAIDKQRLRIRQKLKLLPDVSLVAYLTQIDESDDDGPDNEPPDPRPDTVDLDDDPPENSPRLS